MRTRIALHGLPTLVARALESVIAAEPDLEVIARSHDEVELLLDCLAADLVVATGGSDGCRPATIERVLDVKTSICVLAVEWKSRRAWVYRNEGTQHELPARTIAELADTIRSAVAPLRSHRVDGIDDDGSEPDHIARTGEPK